MPNINQNNEIEHINKRIGLLQYRLNINEKSKNQFQNGYWKNMSKTRTKYKSF